MSLVYGDKKKGPYYDSDWDEPEVIFECKHQSFDRDIVMGLYRRVRAGLGVGLCAECAAKKRKEEHAHHEEERTVQSVATALEEGLQPIEGSRAQVEWAEKIRAEFFSELKLQSLLLQDPIYTDKEREDGREVLGAVRAEVSERVEAKWWIETKHRDNAALHILSLAGEALLRLREVEGKESTRFAPSTCGHENASHLFGPLQKKLCDDCHQKTSQRAVAQSGRPLEILSVAGHLKEGLPPLEGSEKQISWAETIRDKFFHTLLGLERRETEVSPLRRITREAIRRTKAKWWIDNREHPDGLYALLKKEIEGTADINAKEPEARVPKDNLLELEGSEKQVSWAEKIRKDFLYELRQREKDAEVKGSTATLAGVEKVRAFALEQVSAKWWIASPSRDNPAQHVATLLADTMPAPKPKKKKA